MEPAHFLSFRVILKFVRILPLLLVPFAVLALSAKEEPVRERNVIAAIDPVTEHRLGRLWMEQDVGKYHVSTNQQYIDVVHKVADRILNAINERPDLEDWEFTVVDVSQENAFAYPGGSIVIYSGVLDFVKDDKGNIDEEMLAPIIGHEMAHVVQRHSLQSLRDKASLQWVLDNLDSIEAKGKSSRLSQEEIGKFAAIAGSRFTRIQEFEADQLGAFYAALAGYGYTGAIRYSQKIIEKRGERQMLEYVEPAQAGGQFQPLDHPTQTERIAAMREFQKSLRNIAGEFNLGYQLLQNANYDKAINCFKDVVKVFPKSFQTWNNLGKAHHLKYLLQSETSGNEALPREKYQCELTDYFVNLRGQMRGARDLSKAIEYYRQAMHWNPHEPGVKSNLAVALAQTRDSENLEEAEQILKDLLARDGKNKVYLNHLGIVLSELDSSEAKKKAGEYFQKAAEQDYLPAEYNLAIFQLENGNEQAGTTGLRAYLEKDDSGPYADAARSLLIKRNVELPEKKSKPPGPTSVLNVKLGVTRDELIQTLGEPDRMEDAKTTEEDSGQIFWYETSGASFVLSEGRVIAMTLFAPQPGNRTLGAGENIKEALPEFAGIPIGSDTQQILKVFGEPVQISEIQERAEKIFSYGDDKSRIDFRIQLSKVRAITIRKL
jgi:predicted Zn-dependent protease